MNNSEMVWEQWMLLDTMWHFNWPLPVSPQTSFIFLLFSEASLKTLASSVRDVGANHWGSVAEALSPVHSSFAPWQGWPDVLQHGIMPRSCLWNEPYYIHDRDRSAQQIHVLITSMSIHSDPLLSECAESEANDFIASRMGRYPVHRQMFPSKLSSTCCLVGFGLVFSRLNSKEKKTMVQSA